MLCQFSRLIYPNNVGNITPGSYMVAVYTPCEKVLDSAGNSVTQVKAVGYSLPVSDKIRYDMKGQWSKNSKHGLQFEVETYEEVIKPTKEGIIAYLSSGQIKGIGPKLAERIFAAFGLETLDVLDQAPEKLINISGISESKLKKICDSYLANRGARDVIAFLTPYGITPNRAVKLYKGYGKDAIKIVQEHPYRLCELAGIGFKTADKIAMSMGFDLMSPERIEEGILYTLTDAETRGHLCIEKDDFIKECLKTLETPELTAGIVGKYANELISNQRICVYDDCLYSEGFDPTPFAVEYTDLKTGETRKRLPVVIRIAIFRMKYNQGKIAVQAQPVSGGFVATARIYPSYKDGPDEFLAEASAFRSPLPDKPSVSPREWAQTAAVGVALRNAGFGVQFDVAGEDVVETMGDDINLTPNTTTETTAPASETVTPGAAGNGTSANAEEEYTVDPTFADAAPKELSIEERVAEAMKVPCPITKHNGKTLGEVLREDQNAIVWVATKFSGDDKIKEAAQLICDYAMAQTQETANE